MGEDKVASYKIQNNNKIRAVILEDTA